MSVSKRKEHEIRQKKKKVIEAIKKAIDNITQKMDRGESLRDEDLRFLKTMLKEWPALEEGLAEESEEDVLPEGSLRTFVERLWSLRKIGELSLVVEKAGYYRCKICGELHSLGRECMFEEYKEQAEAKPNGY